MLSGFMCIVESELVESKCLLRSLLKYRLRIIMCLGGGAYLSTDTHSAYFIGYRTVGVL